MTTQTPDMMGFNFPGRGPGLTSDTLKVYTPSLNPLVEQQQEIPKQEPTKQEPPKQEPPKIVNVRFEINRNFKLKKMLNTYKKDNVLDKSIETGDTIAYKKLTYTVDGTPPTEFFKSITVTDFTLNPDKTITISGIVKTSILLLSFTDQNKKNEENKDLFKIDPETSQLLLVDITTNPTKAKKRYNRNQIINVTDTGYGNIENKGKKTDYTIINYKYNDDKQNIVVDVFKGINIIVNNNNTLEYIINHYKPIDTKGGRRTRQKKNRKNRRTRKFN